MRSYRPALSSGGNAGNKKAHAFQKVSYVLGMRRRWSEHYDFGQNAVEVVCDLCQSEYQSGDRNAIEIASVVVGFGQGLPGAWTELPGDQHLCPQHKPPSSSVDAQITGEEG